MRRKGLLFIYAASFGLLGLTLLVCLNWHIVQEHWYCYRYKKTQSADYRQKLVKLGERHPELPLSRWFYLLANPYTNDHSERMRDLPPEVHRRALGLWLREHFNGKWWDGWVSKLYLLGHLDDKDYWLPHVAFLRDALRSLPQPPPASALYGIDLYLASWALAICGDDTGLPYLEDMLLEDVNVYPYDPAGITDYYDATRGIVALASGGNERARGTVVKGLARRRVRWPVARQMKALLKRGANYPEENLKWLAEKLAAYEAQCAAEKKLAEERYGELDAEVRRSSLVAYAVATGQGHDFFGTYVVAGRLTCQSGTAFAEKLKVDGGGNWWLYRTKLPFEDCAAFWKEILEFDLWNLPETDAGRGGAHAVFQAGDKTKRVTRSGPLWSFYYPNYPSSWLGAWLEVRLKEPGVRPISGKLTPLPRSGDLAKSWLRGDPWPPAAANEPNVP